MKLKTRYKLQPTLALPTIADMAMLLLIFFVLCGRISNRSNLPIDPPRSFTADPVAPRTPVTVSVMPDGALFLDGRPITAQDLGDELEAILLRQPDRAGRTVRIEVDRKTPYRAYVVAVDAVNRVKGYVELKVIK